MLERNNIRLNAIFALWFLIAGIVPACLVGGLGYVFQRHAILTSGAQELAATTRIRALYLEQYVEDMLATQAPVSGVRDSVTSDALARLVAEGIAVASDESSDLFIVKEDGTVVTTSKVVNAEGARVPLRTWLDSVGPDGEGVSIVSYQGRKYLVHAEPVRITTNLWYLISLKEHSMIIARLTDQERLQLLAYIGSLIVMLGVLYLFVSMISSVLVRPIFKTIRDIVTSTMNIKTGIAHTEQATASQEAVAGTLLASYKDQLKHIKAVDAGGERIVQSLTDISVQTAHASKNVQRIDALAIKGQRDAEIARSSIASIKKLATAHEALISTLTRYAAQVDAIASRVRDLAKAATYVSLNATIEASKSDRSMHAVGSLASEVGKLSLLSKEASATITETVQEMQKQLSESKQHSERERTEAIESLRVITEALESLQRMSKDAMQISQSVQAIDAQVARQSDSTSQIARQMNELHMQAKSIMRGATKIYALAQEQKKSVGSHSTAVHKLSGIVDKLRTLIGSTKRDIWGSARKT